MIGNLQATRLTAVHQSDGFVRVIEVFVRLTSDGDARVVCTPASVDVAVVTRVLD